MSLENLKSEHQVKHIQFITTTNKGDIIESDDVLFPLKSNTNISEIHPFFESTLNLFQDTEKLSFSCVHIDFNNKQFTCDIEIKKIDKNLFLTVITDFSNHYESFQSLVQSRNETSIKSEALILKNQLLKEKELFKNKFIGNFSHEIKSPISSIISFSNLLQKTSLKTEQKDYLNVIMTSSLHLRSVINDILDISKIETGKLEIKNSSFNFRALIDKISTQYKHKCDIKNLDFSSKIDQTTPTFIESDETRISQIIQNLLDNAIKFTNKGHVNLEVKTIYNRAQNATISFVVSDSGVGIDKKYHETIFKRFSRIENSANAEGIGLGLSIVKEIIDLMGGDIYIDSKQNNGTSFTVILKVKTSPLKKEEKVKKPIKKFKPKGARKPNILLVEDNTTHQLSIFKILAKTKHFYLDIVGNGLDAIKAINKSNYDVILMDYKIPYLDGIETSKTIKKMNNAQKSNTPIILITSHIVSEDILQDKGICFNEILEKPFQEETLLNAIQNCLK